MEELITNFLWGMAFGALVFTFIALNLNRKSYFNSNVLGANDEKFRPRFEVVGVEAAEDGEYRTIAKYEVKNYFFVKKNNKNFKYQTFYFYDKIGAYKIGDVITFASI